jgi:23S rRNA (adenine-N6)-dimethyltransferase
MDSIYTKDIPEHYSQNEIINIKLLQKLVNRSGIEPGDLVYDIGAGTGNIAAALLEKGARVVAIEKDEWLCAKLVRRFSGCDRVEVRNTDFVETEFSPSALYKIFANIPFSHTAAMIKKLLFNKAPPEDCYLIVQKEAAEKYAGIPADTLVSLLIKPLFWVDIIYHFSRSDFLPVPLVDIVLLQFERRKCGLIPPSQYSLYQDFIIYCREGTDRTVKQALKGIFSYSQIKRIFRLLGIDYHARPAELSFRQYLCLFQFYIGNDN